MRLVQRHGRIDRIGSKHDEVWLRCFFPDRQLDRLLGLEERQKPVRSSLLPLDTPYVFHGGTVLPNVASRWVECERRDPHLSERLTADTNSGGPRRRAVPCATQLHAPFETPLASAMQEEGLPEWRVKLLLLAMVVMLALTLDN